MEIQVSRELERKTDGTKIFRHYFFNTDKTNYLTKAQSYFTKLEKKQAKLNFKLNK